MIILVGGANLDILGFVPAGFVKGDSNPGKILFQPGGVARNMAQALAARLPSARIELIAPLGDDDNSRRLREVTERSGVSMEHSPVFAGASCPVYLAVMERGDMVAAVNDMALLDRVTPSCLKKIIPLMKQAEWVVLDANLPDETLGFITESLPGVSLAAEPVSAAKCGRFIPFLDRLALIKPNRLEAEKLTGRKIGTVEQALGAAEQLVARGAERAIVTLGSLGAVYASRRDSGHLAALSLNGETTNTNGAGDAFMAAALVALTRGKSLRDAADAGNTAAVETMKAGRSANDAE